MKIKKATTKRERKYGKKDEEGIQTKQPTKKGKVKLMVDGYTILEFKSLKEANNYIAAREKKSAAKRQKPTSFVFI